MSNTARQTHLDCYRDECEGTLLIDGHEKYCDSCFIVVGSGPSTFTPLTDRVKSLWEQREEYRSGEKSGRPYVFGSYTRR